MLTSIQLMERIEKNVGVPWQSQRPDGYSDGIVFGSPNTGVTGIVTSFTPTLNVLRQAVASGKNTIICREGPFYSRGERCPLYFREGPAPSKEQIEADAVCRSKRDYITRNNLTIIRFVDNWDARSTDGQLRGLTGALGWQSYHVNPNNGTEAYDPRNVYFQLPIGSLFDLAHQVKSALKIRGVRVIGDPSSKVRNVALAHGLLLVADAENVLRDHTVDVVVAGDAVEWEAVPYFQDLVTAKMSKGLILVGEEASEEPTPFRMSTRYQKQMLDKLRRRWRQN